MNLVKEWFSNTPDVFFSLRTTPSLCSLFRSYSDNLEPSTSSSQPIELQLQPIIIEHYGQKIYCTELVRAKLEASRKLGIEKVCSVFCGVTV
jgi:hypothetical protein